MDYFKRKYINAREAIAADKNFVSRLCDLWFGATKSSVAPTEYEEFFNWLAQDEPYFVDEYKLKQKITEWEKRKRQCVSVDQAPEGFLNYVEIYSLLAQDEHWRVGLDEQKYPYRKIMAITADILSHKRDWCDERHARIIQKALYERFQGKSEGECFIEFFRLLAEYGITSEIIKKMENLMQERNDELAEAKASGNSAKYFWGKMSRPTQGLLSLALGLKSKRT